MVGKLNGNYGRHPNHKKNVNMGEIGALGRKSQGLSNPTLPEQALYNTLEELGVEFKP